MVLNTCVPVFTSAFVYVEDVLGFALPPGWKMVQYICIQPHAPPDRVVSLQTFFVCHLFRPERVRRGLFVCNLFHVLPFFFTKNERTAVSGVGTSNACNGTVPIPISATTIHSGKTSIRRLRIHTTAGGNPSERKPTSETQIWTHKQTKTKQDTI